MVTEIMSLKKKDLPSENVEQKLNATICKIYNLSYEEVKIITPEFGLSKEEYDNLHV